MNSNNSNIHKINPVLTKPVSQTLPFQNVSDSKLLELANQYITTDESLEKFQARLKEKTAYFTKSLIDKKDKVETKQESSAINPSLGNIKGHNKSLNHLQMHTICGNNLNLANLNNNSILIQNTNYGLPNNNLNRSSNEKLSSNKKHTAKTGKLAKNITTALEYYNMLEN